MKNEAKSQSQKFVDGYVVGVQHGKAAALEMAQKVDWDIVADCVSNPGNYTGDERTASRIRKFAAALKKIEAK